jgi:FkbM family methyltransferase
MDRLRDVALSGMGIGSASFQVDDSGEADLLRRLASKWSRREPIVIIDVGAHAGGYTAAAQTAFGQRARIHCFEPNPALFRSLAQRFDGDAQVRCHQVALGSASGSAPLFLDRVGSSRGSLVEASFQITGRPIEQTHEVMVKTLDGVADEEGIYRVDVLKLDVEGHELAVLEGAARLLDAGRIEAVQFEFGERNLASRTYLRDFFELLGPEFSFFRVVPRGLVRIEQRAKNEIFALETNYLAVRGDTGRWTGKCLR